MNWFDQLAKVWNDGNAQAIAPLFSLHASYSENPFAPSLHGRAAIVAYWQAELANHREVQCVIQPLQCGDDWAFAHWHTTLIHIDSGDHVRLDGVLVVHFNSAGECTNLREWWHSTKHESIKPPAKFGGSIIMGGLSATT